MMDVINLAKIGIESNSPMPMPGKNNGAIADVIQKCLVGKGLAE